MSTRARIAMEMPDGKIKSIYCHYDGYPEGVGATLKKHYNTPEKLEKLLELGDISRLGEFYDADLAKQDWDKWNLESKEERDALLAKTARMTVPYKDRGEDAPARIDDDFHAFYHKIGKTSEDYTYLLTKDYGYGYASYSWEVCETPYFKELK